MTNDNLHGILGGLRRIESDKQVFDGEIDGSDCNWKERCCFSATNNSPVKLYSKYLIKNHENSWK